MKKAGVNWIKALPSYTEALNQDPKEELAWKSPFEIYFGRKPNLVDNTGNTCAKEWDLPLGKYEDMVRPRSKDFRLRSKHVKATRKRPRNIPHRFTISEKLFLFKILQLVLK